MRSSRLGASTDTSKSCTRFAVIPARRTRSSQACGSDKTIRMRARQKSSYVALSGSTLAGHER